MNQPLLTLLFGFILGIEHAFEADHMIAVSTMVTEHKNPFKASLVGTFWGIGHTTTLFIVGIVVLLLKVTIPENVSLSLEMIVGFVLVLLGVKIIREKKETLHMHTHTHDDTAHTHHHLHTNHNHWHTHYHSFIIGLIHGLAGSGALMILVLSTINELFQGVYYILLFGIGSIIGMTVISFFVGIPFIYSAKKFPYIEKYLRTIAGILSIIFGLSIIYEIGFVEGLVGNLLQAVYTLVVLF